MWDVRVGCETTELQACASCNCLRRTCSTGQASRSCRDSKPRSKGLHESSWLGDLQDAPCSAFSPAPHGRGRTRIQELFQKMRSLVPAVVVKVQAFAKETLSTEVRWAAEELRRLRGARLE